MIYLLILFKERKTRIYEVLKVLRFEMNQLARPDIK